MASHLPSTPAITDELQELLICDICAETYDNGIRQAKFLDCHHTFCSECLVSLAGKGQDNPRTILCPNCRHPTHLPENGIGGLQTNFYIQKLKLIPVKSEQTKTVSNPGGCYKHHDQPKSFFCETCKIAICRDCIVLDHDKATGHSAVNFTDAVSAQRHMLSERLNAGLDTKKAMQKSSRQIKSQLNKLDICKDSVIKDLRSIIQSAQQQLIEGERQVTGIILEQYEAQRIALQDKQLQIDEASILLDKYINQSAALVKTGDIGEMININEKLDKTLGKTRLDSAVGGAEENDLVSDMITGTTPLNNSLCRLSKKFFKPFLPTKVGIKSNKTIAGLESVITLTPLNDEGNGVPIAANFLSIDITDPFGHTLPVALTTTHPECTVTFTPQGSGRHGIAVRYLGQKLVSKQKHIGVESNNPVLKFGGPGNGNGTFNVPRGIAFDKSSNCLYVADTGNGLIQKFSAEGEFMSQFNVNGLDKDYAAYNLVVDLNKRLIMCTEILVRDNDHVKGNDMLLFNLEGNLKDTRTLDYVSCPIHIAMNSRGNVFLSDVKEKCVFEADGEGNFLRRMGGFSYPGCICTNDDGKIIVPDAHDNCIYLYTPDGTVSHKFGTGGTGNGELIFPISVATDGEYILVAEGTNKRIQVFRYDGTSVSMIESTADPLHEPRGLAVTDDGHVYVVDRDNHCVKKYKYRDVC